MWEGRWARVVFCVHRVASPNEHIRGTLEKERFIRLWWSLFLILSYSHVILIHPSLTRSILVSSHLISHSISILFYFIPFSDRCWSIKGPNMISFKNSVHHDPVWSSMGGSPSCKNDIFGYFAWRIPCQRECVSGIKGEPVSHPFIHFFLFSSCSSIHPSYPLLLMIIDG